MRWSHELRMAASRVGRSACSWFLTTKSRTKEHMASLGPPACTWESSVRIACRFVLGTALCVALHCRHEFWHPSPHNCAYDATAYYVASTATAIQDAVVELVQNEAGLAKLFRTYHSHDENGEYVLDSNEFRGCLAALLSFDIGVSNADRLFASLDHRRTGTIANDLLMDFLFPMGEALRSVSTRASGAVTAVHLSDDTTKVGVGGAGFATVIDLATGNTLVAATYNHEVTDVRLDPRALTFYVATSDKVDEFETAGATGPSTSDVTREFKYPNGRVLCVEVSTDGHFLLVGGTRKDIVLFDRLADLGLRRQAEPTPLITIAYPSSVTSVAMSRQNSITLALPLAISCLLNRFARGWLRT